MLSSWIKLRRPEDVSAAVRSVRPKISREEILDGRKQGAQNEEARTAAAGTGLAGKNDWPRGEDEGDHDRFRRSGEELEGPKNPQKSRFLESRKRIRKGEDQDPGHPGERGDVIVEFKARKEEAAEEKKRGAQEGRRPAEAEEPLKPVHSRPADQGVDQVMKTEGGEKGQDEIEPGPRVTDRVLGIGQERLAVAVDVRQRAKPPSRRSWTASRRAGISRTVPSRSKKTPPWKKNPRKKKQSSQKQEKENKVNGFEQAAGRPAASPSNRPAVFPPSIGRSTPCHPRRRCQNRRPFSPPRAIFRGA